jgi:hypothetical protein
MVILSGDFIYPHNSFSLHIFAFDILPFSAQPFYCTAGRHLPILTRSPKTDIVIFPTELDWLMSWMKDEKKYSEKDRQKLEKGSGCVKAWTLGCHWIYSFLSW